MTRKHDSNLKLHSRKTGAIILIFLGVFIITVLIFMVLTMNEAEKIQEYEERFRTLSCDEMKKEFESILPRQDWQRMAIFDKGC